MQPFRPTVDIHISVTLLDDLNKQYHEACEVIHDTLYQRPFYLK